MRDYLLDITDNLKISVKEYLELPVPYTRILIDGVIKRNKEMIERSKNR